MAWMFFHRSTCSTEIASYAMHARRMSGGRVSGRFQPNPGSDIGRCTTEKRSKHCSMHGTARVGLELRVSSEIATVCCFDATLQGCNIAAGLCYHLEEGFRLLPNSNTDLFVDVILVKVKSSR
jgi:hypothetical protein